MITSSVVHSEEETSQDIAPAFVEQDSIPPGGLLERWLLSHLELLALAIVAAGFALRIFTATRSYLNPDEALHYLLLNQPSAFLAYKASLTNAHPPLIYLVVYFWHFLGRSEWMLRMPSVFAGTAFCWMFYKWMGLAFGRAASWIGLILATFSPAMVALSAELRAYALLLFCLSGALYFLERALAEKSVRQMWAFTAFLCLAILSHYSAVFFALAVGVYVLARMADSQPPRKVIVAWAEGQAAALAICTFLYVTHLSKIKNSIAVWSTAFGNSYFHKDSIGLFTFTFRNSFGIFLFLFGQPYVSLAIFLCFVIGASLLFTKGLLLPRKSLQSNRLGILLLFPFVGVWCASIAGIYPYIGSRHTAFLAPFAIAGASFLLVAISGRRAWAGVLVAVFAMALSNNADKPVEADVSSGDNSPAMMASAITYLGRSILPGDHILVDYQSSIPFEVYFCGPKVIMPIQPFIGDSFDFTCNGISVVTLRAWKLIPQTLPGAFVMMAQSHGLKPGDRVWVFQTGWGVNMGSDLVSHDAAFRCLAPRKFGGDITVMNFIVGPDLSPRTPPGGC